jgi:hypothetical protein
MKKREIPGSLTEHPQKSLQKSIFCSGFVPVKPTASDPEKLPGPGVPVHHLPVVVEFAPAAGIVLKSN